MTSIQRFVSVVTSTLKESNHSINEFITHQYVPILACGSTGIVLILSNVTPSRLIDLICTGLNIRLINKQEGKYHVQLNHDVLPGIVRNILVSNTMTMFLENDDILLYDEGFSVEGYIVSSRLIGSTNVEDVLAKLNESLVARTLDHITSMNLYQCMDQYPDLTKAVARILDHPTSGECKELLKILSDMFNDSSITVQYDGSLGNLLFTNSQGEDITNEAIECVRKMEVRHTYLKIYDVSGREFLGCNNKDIMSELRIELWKKSASRM